MIWENKVQLIMMLCSEREVEIKEDDFSYWNKINDIGQSTFFKADDQSNVFQLTLKSKVQLNERITHR